MSGHAQLTNDDRPTSPVYPSFISQRDKHYDSRNVALAGGVART